MRGQQPAQVVPRRRGSGNGIKRREKGVVLTEIAPKNTLSSANRLTTCATHFEYLPGKPLSWLLRKRYDRHTPRALKTVGGFAAAGFLLPLLLLAYYTAANHMGKFPSTDLLFYLCPSSIMCMGLEHASISTGIVVWLIIASSNAALYALPGIVVALIFRFGKSNRGEI